MRNITTSGVGAIICDKKGKVVYIADKHLHIDINNNLLHKNIYSKIIYWDTKMIH